MTRLTRASVAGPAPSFRGLQWRRPGASRRAHSRSTCGRDRRSAPMGALTPRWQAVLLLLAVSLPLAACGIDEVPPGEGPSTSSAGSASPTATATATATATETERTESREEMDATAEAMAVYANFSQLIQKARRDPTQDWSTAYAELTADPLRTNELLEISGLRDRGVAHSGQIRNTPEVSDVELAGGTDGTLRTVTIGDCIDSRDFPATVLATGELFSVARPPYPAVATVVFYPDPEERWLVTSFEAQDGTC
jgi:hypothetical protein